MSASSYKRMTKKYAARVDHTDGDVSEGFVLVPVGVDFVNALMQGGGFLHFEMESGNETYLNMQAIKRVTQRIDQDAREARKEADATRRDSEARDRAEAERKAKAEKAKSESRKKTGQSASPYKLNEEFDALDIMGLGDAATHDDIQSTSRRLVKIYHPDRLRGLGVSDNKIAYAAERLAEINNAYRVLAKVHKAA